MGLCSTRQGVVAPQYQLSSPAHHAASKDVDEGTQNNKDSKDKYDDFEDDDEITIKPYGNRSLAWTLQYRKLNPYDKC